MERTHLILWVVRDNWLNAWVYTNKKDAMNAFKGYAEEVAKSYEKQGRKVRVEYIGEETSCVYETDNQDRCLFRATIGMAMNGGIFLVSEKKINADPTKNKGYAPFGASVFVSEA